VLLVVLVMRVEWLLGQALVVKVVPVGRRV
jgi:hypothetical protein